MKKIILLSSVLKPVTEPRMYEKLGKTLRSVAHYDIHIFGALRNQELFLDKISVHEHRFYSRSLSARIAILLQYIQLVFKLKPSILIPSTLDLLLFSHLIKIFKPNTVIVYDMIENFTLNTKKHQHYSKFKSNLVVFVEKIILKFTSNLIFAEKIYQKQIDFSFKRTLILENLPNDQFFSINNKQRNSNSIDFLYSGNLTKEYGVYEVMFFYKKIKSWFPEAELCMIGSCLDQKVLKDLSLFFEEFPEVRKIGIERPASHQQILNEIQNADFGLISYQKNEAFDGKYPTKVYEYLQAKLPMLLFEDQTWNEFVLSQQAGIDCKLKDLTKSKFEMIKKMKFYMENENRSVYTWENHEIRLLEFFSKF